MSILHHNKGQRYIVAQDRRVGILGHSIRDRALFDVETRVPVVVDTYRSQAGAEYHARLLNQGLALIDRHLEVGCRVVPIYSNESTAELLRAP